MRRYVLSLLVLAYIAVIIYAVLRFADSDAVLSIGWKDVIWLSLLSLTNIVLNGIFLREACRALGCFLTGVEAVGLASANALLNYLPLRPGMGFKAVYLASVHRLPVAAFASIAGISVAVALICAGLLGATASLWLLRAPDSSNTSLIVIAVAYAAMASGGLALIVAGGYILRIPLPSSVRRYTDTLTRSIAALSRQRAFQARAYPLTTTVIIIVSVRLYLVAGLLDSPVSAGEAVLLGTAAAISTFVNILPAGLGVREAALSATFVALGSSAETGLLVGAVDRLVALVWAALVGTLWLVAARRQRRRVDKKDETDELTQGRVLFRS